MHLPTNLITSTLSKLATVAPSSLRGESHMTGRHMIQNPLKRARSSSQRSPASARRPNKSPSAKPSPNKKRRLSNPETRSDAPGSIRRTPSVKRQPKLVVRKLSKPSSTEQTPDNFKEERPHDSSGQKDVASSAKPSSAIPSGGAQSSSAKKLKTEKKDATAMKKGLPSATKRRISSRSEEVENPSSVPSEAPQGPAPKRLKNKKENSVSEKNSRPSASKKSLPLAMKDALSSTTNKVLSSAVKKRVSFASQKSLPSVAQHSAPSPSKPIKNASPVKVLPDQSEPIPVRAKKVGKTKSPQSASTKSERTANAVYPEQSVTIHECSFLKPHVAGFTAIAASPCGQYVVLSKTDRNIELLRIEKLQWIPVSIVYAVSGRPDLSISTLKFSPCGRYVFASRLDGSLTIYDVSEQGLLTVVTLQPGGGAIWDMAFAPGCTTNAFRLVVACDDGCVRFVSPDVAFVGTDDTGVLSSDVTHYIIKASDTTPARTLSVDWVIVQKDDASQTKGVDFIVCGDSGGGLRWIDPNSGRTTGRGNISTLRKEAVLIWTVRWVRNGNTIVCGDDRGLVTLWSSRTRTIEAEIRIEGMLGAIWCSSVITKKTRQDEVVAFGGANGSVGALVFPSDVTANTSSLRGALLHTHDVRGMCSLPDGHFMSAGIDAKVAIFKPSSLVEKTVPVQWPFFIDGVVSQPLVTVLRRHGLIVSHGEKEIEFWKIPNDNLDYPIMVLRMCLKSVSSDLRCVAVSEDGMYVAVSSACSFKLYQIWDGVGIIGECRSFGKVKLLEVAEKVEGALYGCVGIQFCGSSLIAITRCMSKIVVFDHLAGRVAQLSLQVVGSDAAAFTKLASGGGRVVACDSKGSLFECTALKNEMLDFDSLRWRKVCDMADGAKMVASLSVSPSGERIAFTCDNMKVVVVHVNKDGFRVDRLPGRIGTLVNAISFSDKENKLLLSGEKIVNVFALKTKRLAKRFGNAESSATMRTVGKFHKIPCNGSLWSSAVLGVGRIALLRRRPSVVETYLPDAIPKKTFGG